MAEEVGSTSKTTTSILDELMNDDTTEETTQETKTDDEKIVPDHELDLDLGETEDEDESEETDDEESKETDKDEETEEEPDLENESELELAKIPSRKEIKAYDPNLFKKFPQLEHALYRDRAFTEIFATVNDAKEAKEQIDQFNGFQGELLDGNIEGVLRSVKNTDPKAFEKISQNVLDALVRTDPNAHLHVTTQVTKGMLHQLNYLAGQTLEKNPDDKRAQQLQIATELIHDALFNTAKVTPFQQTQQQQVDPERQKFESDKQEFEKTRFTAAFNTVSSRTNNILTSEVTKSIDKTGILTPFEKSTVIEKVMAELDSQLVRDRPFKALIDSLWLKAKAAGYSNEALGNLEKALKNKAAIILPGIMKAKKGEAMNGRSVVKKKEKRELSRNTNEDRTPQDNKNLTLNKRGDDRLTRRPGESKLAFLMRD